MTSFEGAEDPRRQGRKHWHRSRRRMFVTAPEAGCRVSVKGYQRAKLIMKKSVRASVLVRLTALNLKFMEDFGMTAAAIKRTSWLSSCSKEDQI